MNNANIREKRVARNFLYLTTGFTIIEMLVVAAIVAILTILILADYRGSEKQYALIRAANQLVSDLRKTQNMALSGAGTNRGYGVYAVNNSASYIIFGDNNGNSRWDGGDIVLETVSLPSKTKILSVSPLLGGGLSVEFNSPAPSTYINGQSIPGLSAVFVLQTTDGSLTKTISATTAGLIQ